MSVYRRYYVLLEGFYLNFTFSKVIACKLCRLTYHSCEASFAFSMRFCKHSHFTFYNNAPA